MGAHLAATPTKVLLGDAIDLDWSLVQQLGQALNARVETRFTSHPPLAEAALDAAS